MSTMFAGQSSQTGREATFPSSTKHLMQRSSQLRKRLMQRNLSFKERQPFLPSPFSSTRMPKRKQKKSEMVQPLVIPMSDYIN